MKDKTSVVIGSAMLGLLAGFGVVTGSVNFKTVSIAGLLALPTTFVTHLVSDSIAQKRINQAEERVKKLERELEKAISQTTFLEDIEARSLHLAKEIDKVRSALNLAIGEHQKAADLNLYLQQSLSTLQADLEASRGKVEELEAECQVWEEEFNDRVCVEAEAKFQQAKKAEIERIFQEHDAITSQAMALFRQLQGWGEKVAHGHQAKREIIKNLAASYNQNLDEVNELIEKERSHYLTQIEVLNERVGQLPPTVAVLLGHILKRGFLEANTPNGRKLPYCVVESCNPLAGISVKNGDELDFCLKWNSGSRAFKGLAEEYRFRKNPSNADYKNSVGYIWVADEIDNSMADLTKDEAKPFKDALKDGGHINLGVIVMGQSANVSTSKGLSIDDQKMLTNIYIDPVSIRTFLTQYGERFYSKRAVEKALATLEELELEIEEKNEVICDTAREFRVAMVTASRSPVFYQLPYFDSVEIDVNSYQQTLAKVSALRDGRGKTWGVASVSPDLGDVGIATVSERPDVSRRSPYVGLETGRDVSDKPACPYCKSDKVRSKGDSWLCQNPDHYLLASGTPKSWKK